MAKKDRFWYIDNVGTTLRFGIVEKGINTTTKDGFTSNYTSVTEAKDVRIYAISRDIDLAKDVLTATWLAIPEQFHEAMVYKAIAEGYKRAKGFDLEKASFFEQEYRNSLREAKKYSRSNYTTTGMIVPQEF